MRIVLTGAGGFLGKAVVPLLGGHEVIATDRMLPKGYDGLEGDLTDRGFVRELLGSGCDAVLHLASMPGAAVASDPERGWQVNLEGLRLLASEAARAGNRPKFVYASSIAVFGDLDPAVPVDDDTAVLPASHYGALKAMGECWLATQHQNRALSAISLRLPGIVARPGAGAGFGSAFLSEIFFAIAQERSFTLPVSPHGTSWLMSVQMAARNMVHALEALDRPDLPPGRALTLPALRVDMARLAGAIARHFGKAPDVVYMPIAEVERAFASYPPLQARAALRAGFLPDESLAKLVAAAFPA